MLIIFDCVDLNRQIWLTMFIWLLPNSQLWIVQMVRYYCFGLQKSQYNKPKVTRHTNGVYELFIHADISDALLLLFYVALYCKLT